ncbi:hypothetical protein, partial [Roseospira marina]
MTQFTVKGLSWNTEDFVRDFGLAETVVVDGVALPRAYALPYAVSLLVQEIKSTLAAGAAAAEILEPMLDEIAVLAGALGLSEVRHGEGLLWREDLQKFVPWGRATNADIDGWQASGVWVDLPGLAYAIDARRPLVKTPTIITPAHGSTDAQLDVTTGPMRGLYGVESGGLRVRWYEPESATIVHDSGWVTGPVTHVAPDDGSINTLSSYDITAQHRDADGVESAESPRVIVTTAETLRPIMGVALVSTGGGAGTWQRVSEHGANLTTTPYDFGGPAWDRHPVWGGIVDEVVDGQAMVRIPAFYYRVGTAPVGSDQAGRTCWWVSSVPADGFVRHPAFRAGGEDIPHFWVAKYQGSNDGGTMVGSAPGVLPLVNLPFATYRSRCQARNVGGVTGFDAWSIYQLAAIQMLAMIEMGGSDSQALIGRGRVDEPVSGDNRARVDAADVAQATYRGIVGLWGNVAQFLAGLRATSSDVIEIWDRDGGQTWVDTGATAAPGLRPVTMRAQSGPGHDFRDVFVPALSSSAPSEWTWPDNARLSGHADAVAHAGGAWDEGDGAGLWRLSVSLTSL